jgi:hypothetical protein
MNWEKVKEILESLNISDEQEKALDEFFAQYTEEVKKSVSENVINESGEEMIPKSQAEQMVKDFENKAEKAFELFEEDSKKAFDLFKKDAEKAFKLYEEDLKEEYSENMIKGLQELYGDVEERVKKDFLESKDASILEGIKKMIMPLVAVDDQQALLEEIDRLKKEKEEVLMESEELTKTNIIESLVNDFPKEYAEEMKQYLSKADSTDNVYERFSFICEMIDNGSFKPKNIINEETKKENKTKNTITEEKIKEPKKENKTKTKTNKKTKKLLTEELNKEVSSSVKSKSKEAKAKIEPKKYFTEEDDQLIKLMFSN